MNIVKCNECGALLIKTQSESKVKIGIEIQDAGYIYKNACLFSDKFTSLYFCNDKCAKNFYMVNIPKTEKNIAFQKALEKTRTEIPQMAKECANGLAKFIKLLKSKQLIDT